MITETTEHHTAVKNLVNAQVSASIREGIELMGDPQNPQYETLKMELYLWESLRERLQSGASTADLLAYLVDARDSYIRLGGKAEHIFVTAANAAIAEITEADPDGATDDDYWELEELRNYVSILEDKLSDAQGELRDAEDDLVKAKFKRDDAISAANIIVKRYRRDCIMVAAIMSPVAVALTFFVGLIVV